MTNQEAIRILNEQRNKFMDEWVDYGGVNEAYNIAIQALKEHEAVEPYSMNAERTYGICPQCGKIIFRYGNIDENRYCGVCGKAVKWDGRKEIKSSKNGFKDG